MNSIAHIRESDGAIQTVEEHLLGVKELAELYGEKIGVKHIAGLTGMLHDLGKYSNEFRKYILAAVSDSDSASSRGSVDHSTAGGKLLYELYHSERIERYKGIIAEIAGNAIISHHSYLQDFLSPNLESNYLNRVRDKEVSEYESIKHNFFKYVMNTKELENYVEIAAKEVEDFLAKDIPENYEKILMFLNKFIFSILIDADRTDTRIFEENVKLESPKNTRELFTTYYEKVMLKIDSFKNNDNANTPINILRSNMSDQCAEFADKPSGIYSLSIPTGGGKTLASLRYALKHAVLHNKKRIIYIVPYTTIIEQNADVVRKMLKDEINVLEHHSNIVEDKYENDRGEEQESDVHKKLKLAKDNWDVPIIFTTMVQFLNVFYASGSRNTRKLHNLSDSVIIFDEVQKVPIHCVSLFNDAVNFLNKYARSTIILCTATQPALDYVENKLDISSDAEMIENLETVNEAFKRVEIIDKATDEIFNNCKLVEFLGEKLEEVHSILVILNTKSVVKQLYELLKENRSDIHIYHLSTSMCAAHRNSIIKEISAHLEDIRQHPEKDKRIMCISTQLIEAGVDISFDCVIRSLAGLDSIAQAAGRCNRNGEKDIQYTYVIDHEEENLSRLKEIKIGKEVTRRILIDIKNDSKAYGGNILSTEAMEKYFKEYYTEFKASLDYPIPKLNKKMTELLYDKKTAESSYYQAYRHNKKQYLPLFICNSCRTAAENFQVIEDCTTTVIVPYGEGKEIITKLSGNETIESLSQLLRRAQQYTINIYDYEKSQLEKNNGIVSYFDGKILALKEGAYNEEYGLDIKNDSMLDFCVY